MKIEQHNEMVELQGPDKSRKETKSRVCKKQVAV